ncbi:MAG: lipid II flippase MurJ, partial [Stagnimonas sp.]|nr:lipid II flippase MurJ [Stagnimonas sp.]
LGIFGIAVGTAILPALSAQHAQADGRRFSETLDWSLRTILIIGLPAAAGMLLLAGPLVATIYGHGRFSADDVRMTTYALWAYGAGFMGFSLIKVLVPGFYARQETKLPVRFAVIGLISGMAFSFCVFLADQRWQLQAAHAGLAISTTLTAWVNAILLYRRLRKDAIYRPSAGWARFALRIAAATLAMTAVVLAFAGPIELWLGLDAGHRALRLALVIGAAMLAYFGVLFALGLRLRDLRPRRG